MERLKLTSVAAALVPASVSSPYVHRRGPGRPGLRSRSLFPCESAPCHGSGSITSVGFGVGGEGFHMDALEQDQGDKSSLSRPKSTRTIGLS